MKQRQGYYMVIPAKVWDTELSEKAILTYGHISVLVKKEGYCYANNSYFMKKLKVKVSSIKRYLNELEDERLIKRVIIYEEDSKIIKERRIYLMDQPGFIDEPSPGITDEPSPGFTDGPDNNTRNNNTSNNIIDDNKGKIFFRIVEAYPKNRIGNRQHGLKKFNELDMDQCKLAAKNLKRYLKLTEGYNKSLQNYIAEECFTEKWLQAKQKNKSKKGGSNYIDTTHNFNGEY